MFLLKAPPPWDWRETQQLRVLPALPEKLSSNPNTHIGQLPIPLASGDPTLPFGFHVHSRTCDIHSHKHTYT